MSRIKALGIVAFILAALILVYSQQTRQLRDPQPTQVASRMTDEQRFQTTITTQQRLNRHFHNNVIPKLRNCWSRVKGSGTIQINHNYARDASGNWVAKQLTVGKSTLPRGQEAVALRCMQDAARDSSFPVASADGDSKEYVVKWTWPVPFPANAEEQKRAMFAGTTHGASGGCDGHGGPPSCYVCSYSGNACFDSCNGYHECRVQGGGCGASRRCTSGSPFSVVGRGVIY